MSSLDLPICCDIAVSIAGDVRPHVRTGLRATCVKWFITLAPLPSLGLRPRRREDELHGQRVRASRLLGSSPSREPFLYGQGLQAMESRG